MEHGIIDVQYQGQTGKRRLQEVRRFYAPFVGLTHSQLVAEAPIIGLTAEVLETNPWQILSDYAESMTPQSQLFLGAVQLNHFAEWQLARKTFDHMDLFDAAICVASHQLHMSHPVAVRFLRGVRKAPKDPSTYTEAHTLHWLTHQVRVPECDLQGRHVSDCGRRLPDTTQHSPDVPLNLEAPSRLHHYVKN